MNSHDIKGFQIDIIGPAKQQEWDGKKPTGVMDSYSMVSHMSSK
jgi:hypothetical protein